ncbi:MAG: tetratricopeptide repeat protein, partial [Betaproteobacteria bacterium]
MAGALTRLAANLYTASRVVERMLRWIFKSQKRTAPEPSTPGPPHSPGVGVGDPVVAVPQKLDIALQSHRAGRLSEAEAAYSEVLSVDPENIDALHFLGVIAYQRGEHGRAEELISRALSRNTSNAPAHSNLGNALGAQGKLDAAIACYQQALAL